MVVFELVLPLIIYFLNITRTQRLVSIGRRSAGAIGAFQTNCGYEVNTLSVHCVTAQVFYKSYNSSDIFS